MSLQTTGFVMMILSLLHSLVVCRKHQVCNGVGTRRNAVLVNTPEWEWRSGDLLGTGETMIL